MSESRLNILNEPDINSPETELGCQLIEAGMNYHRDNGTETNAMLLLQAAASLMRFAVETAITPEMWDKTLEWIGEDLRTLSAANFEKKYGKKETVN